MATSEIVDDNLIWPGVLSLYTCLQDKVAAAGLAVDCFMTIFPGESVDLLAAKNGAAWVRVIEIFPSKTIPSADSGNPNSCGAPLAATIEVGIVQCITINMNAKPLTTQQNIEFARLQMAGMNAGLKAIRCCDIDEKVLGAYTPVGPEGGIYGGVWTLTIAQGM